MICDGFDLDPCPECAARAEVRRVRLRRARIRGLFVYEARCPRCGRVETDYAPTAAMAERAWQRGLFSSVSRRGADPATAPPGGGV